MQKFSDVSYETSDKHKDVTSLFQYELCTYPAALCESSSLPMQPNKAVLADYLWKSMKEEQRNPSGDVQYVLDGGPLLHRVSWPEAPPMGVWTTGMLGMWLGNTVLLPLFSMDITMIRQPKTPHTCEERDIV